MNAYVDVHTRQILFFVFQEIPCHSYKTTIYFPADIPRYLFYYLWIYFSEHFLIISCSPGGSMLIVIFYIMIPWNLKLTNYFLILFFLILYDSAFKNKTIFFKVDIDYVFVIDSKVTNLFKYIFWVTPLTAKLFNWNFHQLKVVFCWRDPQLQVTKCRSVIFKTCWLMSRFVNLKCLKAHM